jgi:hypothetical protein
MDKFNREHERVDADSKAYEARLEAYNRQVDHWNAEGGAPPDVAAEMDTQKSKLASERTHVRQAQAACEAMRLDANSLVGVYNDSVARYYSAIGTFNDKFGSPIRENVGDCLISGSRATRITIFAFDDANHLAVVLAHEFGHALGLHHVEGDNALMSAVERGDSLENDLRVTARDRAELRRALRK